MKLLYFVVISMISCISACNFTVAIKQSLELDGFHRNMTYDLSFNTYEDGEPKMLSLDNCFITLHQMLPRGVYVNADELNEFKRFRNLQTLTRKANIELSAQHSEPLMVYIFEEVTGAEMKMWLPVHARYHKAVLFGGYAMNTIEMPLLYMRCPGEKLEKCDTTLETKFFCTSRSRDMCMWKKIPYMSSTESPVIWRTPVGDLNHYNVVSSITALAITIGSIYLMLTINSAKSLFYKQ